MQSYLEKNKERYCSSTILSSVQFQETKLNLDIVFCIAVFDVVLEEDRYEIICSSHKNLKKMVFLF